VIRFSLLMVAVWALLGPRLGLCAEAADRSEPLVIGDTFTIDSKTLEEARRINVYLPPGYKESRDSRVPVLYMPDGGLGEDFLHVAGLVQISVINGTMRPFLLVGLENTQRRRDMTGPTENEDDKKIAPQVGGSLAFRKFIRSELMPRIRERYRTTGETAIVGESLAGLFVVETFLLEPDLFDTYVAIDPSLWWNGAKLVNDAADRLRALSKFEKNLYFASSDERGIVVNTTRLAEILRTSAPSTIHWHYESMPQEKHSTIYHPAALKAFRDVFKPRVTSGVRPFNYRTGSGSDLAVAKDSNCVLDCPWLNLSQRPGRYRFLFCN
jgi:predicted alpha/beta superfamily hydrolase